MKFTVDWLKTHLETGASLTAITDGLTQLGLEVEEVINPGSALIDFRVGHVVEVRPHPNVDRARLCLVNTGTEEVEVVCGAPNVRAGMKSVFAALGTVIPRTGSVLKVSAFHGIFSQGMLCSGYELGLSDDRAGILELPGNAPVGAPITEVLGLDDPVIDIAITPNRADALGVRGVARDLAAAGLGHLTRRRIEPVPGRFLCPIAVRFALSAAPEACPLFVGRLVRGIRNGPSPAWLQRRLTSVGLRPISALVDITTFLAHDINRPLHVFDAGKIKGDLLVRLAKGGEALEALTGRVLTLPVGATVVCDDRGPISLAGVVGGTATGVDEATTDVFIEAAFFDPLRTAQTGRRLDLLSDARYRFERGVDPGAVFEGMEAATRLVLDLCGGEASELIVSGAVPNTQRQIALRRERVTALGGVSVVPERQEAILASLGFTMASNADGWTVEPPSWRRDIEGEADLVEEVLRIYGYDQIPTTRWTLQDLPKSALSAAQRRVQRVRRLLAARGLHEAITWSFLSQADAERFGGATPGLALANPMSVELAHMRPAVLPNLLAAARRNADRGYVSQGLFEIGPIFVAPVPGGQLTVAAGLRTDEAVPRHWQGGSRAVDLFDSKADVQAIFAELNVAAEQWNVIAEAPPWYHPGRSGSIRLGQDVVLANFGELHPGVLAAAGLDVPAVGFELFLDRLPPPRCATGTSAGQSRPPLRPSPFQPVDRDFAFVLDCNVDAEAVLRAAKLADEVLIRQVRLFDLYEGEGIPDGMKSLAIAVRLRAPDRTLSDADVEAVGAKIVAAVAKATGGRLRM